MALGDVDCRLSHLCSDTQACPCTRTLIRLCFRNIFLNNFLCQGEGGNSFQEGSCRNKMQGIVDVSEGNPKQQYELLAGALSEAAPVGATSRRCVVLLCLSPILRSPPAHLRAAKCVGPARRTPVPMGIRISAVVCGQRRWPGGWPRPPCWEPAGQLALGPQLLGRVRAVRGLPSAAAECWQRRGAGQAGLESITRGVSPVRQQAVTFLGSVPACIFLSQIRVEACQEIQSEPAMLPPSAPAPRALQALLPCPPPGGFPPLPSGPQLLPQRCHSRAGLQLPTALPWPPPSRGHP